VDAFTISRSLLFRLGFALLFLLGTRSEAVILYSGDNSANLIAPDAARMNVFEAVARVCNSTGGQTAGSAVHIRGKYLLTANHVANRSHVTFDGSTFHAVDSAFTPVKIGEADMKLIKLINDPGLPEKPLFTGTAGDVFATGTLVGWGRGRDPAVSDSVAGATNTWQWGDASTEAKRWGTNRIDSSITLEGPFGNTYTALVTTLNRDAGNNEAGAALFDSGSGLFVDDAGTWKLAGLATAVSTADSSTFGTFLNWDRNYFVRISSYSAGVEAAIPDTSTLSGWKIDHSLYGAGADNDADPDFDGIPQLLEFAFGGDPNQSDPGILPTAALVEEGGNTYLELSVTRPAGLQGLAFTPQTTTDLSDWPVDSSGIADANPTPQNNGDGTETLVYRRSQPLSDEPIAFIRVRVSEIL